MTTPPATVSATGGSCAMTIQHQLGHPEDGSICTTPTEVHDFLSYAIANYNVDPQPGVS